VEATTRNLAGILLTTCRIQITSTVLGKHIGSQNVVDGFG
jgi:hypothetical protein